MNSHAVVRIDPPGVVPVPLIRSNQAWLVLGTLVAILTQAPWVVAVLWLVAILPLAFGPRFHLIFRAVRPFWGQQLRSAPTEPADLQRFNQVIASTCLFVALILAATGQMVWASVFCGFVLIAAASALLGYCIGCQLFLPYRRWAARERTAHPMLGPLLDFVAGSGRFRFR